MFWVDVCLGFGRKSIRVNASAMDKITANMLTKVLPSPSAS